MRQANDKERHIFPRKAEGLLYPSSMSSERTRLYCEPADGEENFVRSLDGAGKRACNFRDAHPASIGNGNFNRSKSGQDRFNLHFDGPAEGLVLHVEGQKGRKSDGAKGSEVRETSPPEPFY